MAPLRSGTPSWTSAERLADQLSDWEQRPSLHVATDLVGAALLVGSTPTADKAAEAVLASDNATGLARRVAQRVLDGGESRHGSIAGGKDSDSRDAIRNLKARLARDPRNSIAWAERARYYTIEGQAKAAVGAMRIALALAPDHRYILRAAARLAIHNGEFDEAYSVVSRSRSSARDPWLMATEIAAAEVAGRSPKSWRAALRVLDSGSFTSLTTSELASALGTLELRAGSQKRARRLFERALVTPNENSIAQGEWASRQLPSMTVAPNQLEVSWEARAQQYAEEGKSSDALQAAWRWLEDQPFSSGPAEVGSYQASLDQDFAAGAEIARAGLRANPGEFLLTNNLAFCLISQGDTNGLEEGRRVLASIDAATLDRDQRSTYLATTGLLAFRSGDVEGGRKRYERSIESTRDRHAAGIALVMLAREEIRARTPLAIRLLQRAKEASESNDVHPDLRRWLRHLPESIDRS